MNPNMMVLVQTLISQLQSWIKVYEKAPKTVQSDLVVLDKKQKVTALLDALPPLLASKRANASVSEKLLDSDFELKWWGQEPIVFQTKQIYATFLLEFKEAIIDESQIIKDAKAFFPPDNSEQKATRTELKTNQDGFIGYRSFIDYPSTFLSGEIQIEVEVSYNGSTKTLYTKISLPGITEAGRAILDFLNGLTIREALIVNCNTIKNNYLGKVDAFNNFSTLQELETKKQEIKGFVGELEQMVVAYNGFSHKTNLDAFLDKPLEQGSKLFGRHYSQEFKDTTAAQKHINALHAYDFPNNTQTNHIAPLLKILEALDIAIKLFNEKIEKAEAEFQNAKSAIAKKKP